VILEIKAQPTCSYLPQKNDPLGHVHHSLPQEIIEYNLLYRKKNKTNKIAYTNYTFKFEESFL